MLITFYNPQEKGEDPLIVLKLRCKKIYVNAERLYVDGRWCAYFRDGMWILMDILEFGGIGYDRDNPLNVVPEICKYYTIEVD